MLLTLRIELPERERAEVAEIFRSYGLGGPQLDSVVSAISADPERWVPDGYILIHIDSRGAGQSPGFLDPRSFREVMDLYEAIEWAAKQPWSTGKIGMLGISYYAINQWQVAALQPPSLKAIVPWEGSSNIYRDQRRHGGILSNNFPTAWWPRQVLPSQHGNASTHYRDPDTGKQPISVALVQLSQNIQLTVLIAAMVIASIPMVALFLVFQRHIIAGISAGSTKG